jgi:STE24 endopeptidase
LNLPKSSRYHRARRRSEGLAGLLTVALLGALILTPASGALRTMVGGSVAGYSAVLLALHGLLQLPLSGYRGWRLERQYQLTDVTLAGWLTGQIKTALLALAVAVPLAEFVYWTMRWPEAWWVAAAGGSALVIGLLTAVAPVLLLPLLHRSRPLSRDELRDRLERLSARAGVAVLDVHELPLGERSRRASAALVGAGSTRRILLSDTLLANYSDDEIEVVMAHEMGHHVHRHTMKAMAVEVLLLFAGFRLAASVLAANWRALGLSSVADVAGLPVIVLSVAGVMLLATPLLNAWSRAHERRADRFALSTASEPAAFIGAVRRMAAHNLAEEHPSSAAFLLFHTHPTVEERVAAAREMLRGGAER